MAGKTFPVSKVTPATSTLGTLVQQKVFNKLLGTAVESCSTPDANLVSPFGFHGLIEAAHRAYDRHYGLSLSPDDLWVTITQGFASIINNDPEAFRGKFVTHEGKKEIRIRRDEFVMGEFGNDWQGCFGEFSAAIRDHIGTDKHTLLVSDFTTTGPMEKAISELTLMDTVQAYFEYVVETRCGIPNITLRGTTEDWKKLETKVAGLAQFGDLEWWLKSVRAIVAQFVAASEGNVDATFWEKLYKGKNESGGINMTGWILQLLPYTKDYRGNKTKNPLLSAGSSGVNNADLPASLSNVPFIWDYYGTRHDYQFIGGIVGYTQSADGGVLSPTMGWAVRPKPAEGAVSFECE